MSFAGWAAIVLLVLVLAAVGIAIWGYPRDGSF